MSHLAQCHQHIHCDPVLLLLGLDVNVKSMPVPSAVLCQPWCSLFSGCHIVQLTPSSFVTMKMSCSSTHTVMDTRDTLNFSAQKLACPQMLMVSLLKVKASKGVLGLRIGSDRLLCKLLGGCHCSVLLRCFRQSPPLLFLLKCPLALVQHHGTWLCPATQVGWRYQR